MKRLFLVLTIAAGALTAALMYERIFIEHYFGPASIAAMLAVVVVFAALLASYLLYGTRHKSRVLSAWLVLFSIVVPFFVLDLIAGFFLIKPLSPAMLPDPNRHHSLIPNTYSRIEQRDFSYVQRVDTLGLRGAEFTREKPAGTFRILMFGDSFTMGKGIHDNETSSVLLQERLNAKTKACGGPAIQVLNAGVDSYAPILSLIQLRELGGLGADVVLENLDVSDLSQEQTYRRIGGVLPDSNPVRVPGVRLATQTLTDRIRTWIDHHLVFTRFILVSVNKMFNYGGLTTDALALNDPEIVNYTLAGDTVDRRQQWHNIFDSIDRMKVLAQSKGADFVLTVYPWPHQYSDTSWIPGRYAFMSKTARTSDVSVNTIEAMAKADTIDLMNAYPAFRAYRGNKDLYYKYDMHWTPAGASVMAGALGDYLEARYLTRWCKKP